MRRWPIYSAAVLAGLGGAANARGEAVDFKIVAQAITVNKTNSTATFELTFDRKPQFIPTPHGESDAFQYEIDADTTSLSRGIDFSDIDTVIRGNEIFEGQGIPIRQRDGDGGANSGGWGPVRALLPFEVTGNTVKFTTDLAAIGDTPGQFRYRFFTTDNGAVTTQVVGAVIPLPSAVWPGFAMLAGLYIARRISRLAKIV